jgi:hypothetical protein
MSAAASSRAADGATGEPEEIGSEVSQPDIYNFTESSGHHVGDLQDAYSALEGNYWADDEEDKVVVSESKWNQVEEMLENSSEETESEAEKEPGWKEKASSYFFENDSTYVKGGLAAGGTGLLSGALGYTTAADLLVTGGAASIGWGIGSALGKYLSSYMGWEEEDEASEAEDSSEHKLDEYSDWEIEVLDMEEYGEALHEYREQG